MHTKSRWALSALLSAAIAFPSVIATQAIPAYGEPGAEQGTITINSPQENAVTYRAYQLFSADVAADGTASNIHCGDGLDTVLADAIEYLGYDPVDFPTDESILELLTSEWGLPLQDATRILENNTLGSFIADDALNRGGLYMLVDANTAQSLDEGWWVIVLDPDRNAAENIATAPIFAVINHDEPVVINEKLSLPTIRREVCEQADYFMNVADAYVGQDLTMRIVGTVGYNVSVNDGNPYPLTIVDEIPGFNANQIPLSDLEIWIDATQIDENDYNAYVDEGKLKITFDDLKSLNTQCTVTPESHICVYYRVPFGIDANDVTYGTPGNILTATLTCPDTDGEGISDTSTVYSYEMELTKVDKDRKGTDYETLDGAKFTIQAEGTPSGHEWGSFIRNNESKLETLIPMIWESESLPSSQTTLELAYSLANDEQKSKFFDYDGNVLSWSSEAQDLYDILKEMKEELNPADVDELLTDEFANRYYDYLVAEHEGEERYDVWRSKLSYFMPTYDDDEIMYVQADGSLASTPYEFETQNGGRAYVPGLSDGSYIIVETQAPSSEYNAWDSPIRLVISRSLDNATASIDSLEAVLTGGEWGGATSVGASTQDGVIYVQAGDEKKFILPVTGLDGVAVMIVVGFAIITISLIQIHRNRKQD